MQTSGDILKLKQEIEPELFLDDESWGLSDANVWSPTSTCQSALLSVRVNLISKSNGCDYHTRITRSIMSDVEF